MNFIFLNSLHRALTVMSFLDCVTWPIWATTKEVKAFLGPAGPNMGVIRAGYVGAYL
jgi:hypothetical protein